jgi:hypothetical protein
VHLVRKATDGLHLNPAFCLRKLPRGVAIRSVLELQEGVARSRDVTELAMPSLHDRDTITLVSIRAVQLRHLHDEVHVPARRKEIRLLEMFVALFGMSEV